MDIQPAIDPEQAAALLKTAVEGETGYAITYGGSIGARELELPKTELIIYPVGDQYVLAYRVDMEYVQPEHGRWSGFVDAHTGAVLKKFSQIERTTVTGSVYGSGQGYYGVPRIINITKVEDDSFYLTDKTKPMYRVESGVDQGVIETYDSRNPFFAISSTYLIKTAQNFRRCR